MDVGKVRTNYSHQTNNTLLQEYKYRIEALQRHISFLEAQIENNNNQINKNT